jgi:hypothetical protein
MADSLLEGNHTPTLTKEDIIAKWKDKPQEELLAAKAESDLYIEMLKTRFDDLSKDYLETKEREKTGAQLKELLDRLDNPPKDTNPDDTNKDQVPPSIKPEDIDRLVSEKLTQHQRTLKQNENLAAMQAKLRESFGNDYQPAYKNRLDTLGLTPEFADDLAKNYPSAFMKTFGLDQQPTQTSPSILPRTSQRPTTFSPSAPKRDWNYYQEMKKSNPRLYLDPKIAVQMYNDAQELGPAFGMPED